MAGWTARPPPYQFGLWQSVRVAAAAGWAVHVYHDGSVETVLRRFRHAFPPTVLRCIRVRLGAGLQGLRYVGCLWRLLAADDPAVDVFLSRDLDDPLDPEGLRMVEDRWLARRPIAGVHRQSEPYDTPRRRNMVNLGWYGQRRIPGQPSIAPAIAAFARNGAHDYYTADEEFVTDVWIPASRMTHTNARKRSASCAIRASPRCGARDSWASSPGFPATRSAGASPRPGVLPPGLQCHHHQCSQSLSLCFVYILGAPLCLPLLSAKPCAIRRHQCHRCNNPTWLGCRRPNCSVAFDFPSTPTGQRPLLG